MTSQDADRKILAELAAELERGNITPVQAMRDENYAQALIRRMDAMASFAATLAPEQRARMVEEGENLPDDDPIFRDAPAYVVSLDPPKDPPEEAADIKPPVGDEPADSILVERTPVPGRTDDAAPTRRQRWDRRRALGG